MPGDDVVTDPSWQVTYAVTMTAPPADVWPWLVQMGIGRAGFYSYDMIEKRLGLDVHSVELIVPELQGLKVGDAMPFGAFDLPVVSLEPDRLLLLEAEDSAVGAGSFCFELLPVEEETRLVFRGRARFAEWDVESATKSAAGLRQLPMILGFEPGSFVMFRRMLLGLKERAERTAREGRNALTAPDGWWAERVMAMDQQLAEREALLDEGEADAEATIEAEAEATTEAVLESVRAQVAEAKARVAKVRKGIRDGGRDRGEGGRGRPGRADGRRRARPGPRGRAAAARAGRAGVLIAGRAGAALRRLARRRTPRVRAGSSPRTRRERQVRPCPRVRVGLPFAGHRADAIRPRGRRIVAIEASASGDRVHVRLGRLQGRSSSGPRPAAAGPRPRAAPPGSWRRPPRPCGAGGASAGARRSSRAGRRSRARR